MSKEHKVNAEKNVKFTKLPSQHSMLGHHGHTKETLFERHFAGGLMMARF